MATTPHLAFVGGLTRAASKEDVLALVATFGIQSALNFSLVPSRGFGFLRLSSAEEHARLLTLRQVTLHDRPVYFLAPDSAAAPTVIKLNVSSAPARRGATLFVFSLNPNLDSRAMHSRAMQALLTDAATQHSKAGAPSAHVVRKQSGSAHKGYAFVACQSAADAALVMAGLQADGWRVEWMRPKGKPRKGGKHRGRKGKRRGGGHGCRPGDCAAFEARLVYGDEDDGDEDAYEQEFEGDEDDQALALSAGVSSRPTATTLEAVAAKTAEVASPHREQCREVLPREQCRGVLASLLGDEGGNRDGGGIETAAGGDLHDGTGSPSDGDAQDALVAMGEFVTSSTEWSAFVNGFLLQHCRTFDDSEENRLEWHTLHLEFCSQLEALLEQQLSILGVAVDDFVELLGEKPRENYDAFLEAVLAIDDFGRFKAAMLDLKRDLLGYTLPADMIDHVKGAWTTRHTGLADF